MTTPLPGTQPPPLALPLAEREREYSPSSCIGGNYAPHLQEYADLSAAALRRHTAQRHLAYGGGGDQPVNQPTQRLDLFLPPSAPGGQPPALLVFIHGGYWQELSKDSALFPASGCLPAGVAFAALDYTLAPQASVQAMVLECRQALRWLHANAARLGVDPARITVAGSSAGAHLAAMCCLRGWAGDADLPPGLPAAAVLVSGIYDLAPLVGTSINQALGLTEESALPISPQHQGLQGFPPSVVCWGAVETAEFKRQSRDFAAALPTPPATIEVPARNHFNVILDLATPGTLLGDATLRMLHNI